MKAFLFSLSIIALTAVLPALAQQADSITVIKNIDADDSDTWNLDFDTYVFPPACTLAWHNDAPTVELSYGITTPDYSHKGFNEKNVEHNYLDLKLGYTDTHTLIEDSSIIEYDFSYLKIVNSNRDWVKKYSDEGLKINSWSIGMHNSDGYGYKLWDDAALLFYHSEGFDWTVMNFGDYSKVPDSATTAANKASLKLYDDHVRFGKAWESGVKIYLTKGVAIDAAYQRSVVYPRHLFFYGAVSSGIELISQHILSGFLEDGGKGSKAFLPIASFVLKSALSYGFYELRQNNMNWPIKTAAPFMFETMKVGMTFSL